MELGRKIARLRKRQGLTQQALAERLGVSDKAVSKWERGLSCPDVSLLVTLASALGVSVDALLGDGEPAREECLSVEKYFMGNYGYVVPDLLPSDARVVFLIDSPDLDECAHGYPLSGRAGEALAEHLFGERTAPTPRLLSEKGIGAVYVSNVPLCNTSDPLGPLVGELEFIRLGRDHIDRYLAERFVSKMTELLKQESIERIVLTRWFNQKYFAYFLSRATRSQLAELQERIAKGQLRIPFVGPPVLWSSELEGRYGDLKQLKAYFAE